MYNITKVADLYNEIDLNELSHYEFYSTSGIHTVYELQNVRKHSIIYSFNAWLMSIPIRCNKTLRFF